MFSDIYAAGAQAMMDAIDALRAAEDAEAAAKAGVNDAAVAMEAQKAHVTNAEAATEAAREKAVQTAESQTTLLAGFISQNDGNS